LWENSHREVIGLAKDRKWAEEAQPFMYLPLFQKHPWPASEMTLHIHTTVDPQSLIAAVRNEVQAVDHRLPIFNIGTLAEFINDELGAQRMAVIIIGLSGLLALILASVGLYGVMSYTVLQRTHEIGVRLALGAQARDVLKLVVEQGMKLALFGVGLGLAGALALTRLLKTLLFGVSATDPLTFIVIALLLALVALLACYTPARRATKVEPIVALRCE
jgi:putative ABC transport system permease protein